MTDFQLTISALKSLSVYRSLLDDPIVVAYLEHLAALSEPGGEKHPAHTYSRVYHLLAQTVNPTTTIDAWQNHLLDLILDNDNPFSRAAYTTDTDYNVYLPAVGRDLAILRLAFETCAAVVLESTTSELRRYSLLPGRLSELPPWVAPGTGEQFPVLPDRRQQLKERLISDSHWENMSGPLAYYYGDNGYGLLGHYIAFKWENGGLQGIRQPDPVTLAGLIGYEDVRKEIIRNTLQFLHGYPANNMLLYGDRGTGKSSTIKALLNEYYTQGLRLIEVPKQQLAEFPIIITLLRNRKHRFILFVDDLSFEENETGYKDLKALLEGGIEARPANVIIYATSNRRHLVRETFADRQEIHEMDSVQEKLSLSDRFGITIIFPGPNQELFLEIVAGLAGRRNLNIDQADLRRRALQWSAWHNGRSPRSARQFVDYLEGELALQRLGV